MVGQDEFEGMNRCRAIYLLVMVPGTLHAWVNRVRSQHNAPDIEGIVRAHTTVTT